MKTPIEPLHTYFIKSIAIRNLMSIKNLQYHQRPFNEHRDSLLPPLKLSTYAYKAPKPFT